METITVSEASRQLDMPPRDLYRAIDEGRIPAYRVGHEVRIRLDDLAAFKAA